MHKFPHSLSHKRWYNNHMGPHVVHELLEAGSSTYQMNPESVYSAICAQHVHAEIQQEARLSCLEAHRATAVRSVAYCTGRARSNKRMSMRIQLVAAMPPRTPSPLSLHRPRHARPRPPPPYPPHPPLSPPHSCH
eukprot:9504181-Pyramimonas_sp.AAC.2